MGGFGNTVGIEHTVRGLFGSSVQGTRQFAYFGGITMTRSRSDEYYFDHGYADLYRVDLQTGKTNLEAKGSERDHEWVVSGSGEIVGHSEYDQPTGKWRLYAGLRPNTSPLIEKISSTNGIGLLGLGRAPATALIVDRSGDADLLEEISTADGKAQALLAHRHVIDYWWDPDTHLFIGATILDSSGRGFEFFDPGLQARITGAYKAFPGLQIDLTSFSRGFAKIIVKTDGGDDSGTYWLVDSASRKADPLGYAYPDIKPADVGATKTVSYQAGDGTALEGILTLPPGRAAENLPLVIFPHGGPLDVSDHVGFDWWAQALASRGYAVFQLNYRGSSGYGGDFRRAGFGQWGRKMLSDISEGIGALAAQNIIDPKRVCIMGASYGGYAALAGVTLQQGLYRCAVSVAGPADLLSFGVWQENYYGFKTDSIRYWRLATGADSGGDELLRAISPALHAERADASVLLIHGKDDIRVPIEQSEQMAGALKRAGKPYEFVTLPHEDHFLSREATRTAMLKATVAFIEKYNPP